MAEETEKLSASQRAKIRRLSQPKELAPDEEGGELNIVPFLDIVTNVLMFVLATVSVTFTATIDTYPPRAGGAGARAPTTKTLSLTVIIVNEGFSIKASGGNVAPGCADTGPGIAIPKKGNDYDFEGLRDCAAKLKSASPDFENEEQVTVSANPNIPYQLVIGAIDHLREVPNPNDPQKPRRLFPEVNFGLAR
ncbi:MAG: biopolymer transporter ExbD [Myxococcales bacterium]|jgi:biopolymer transport protein TolR|nr:biopolymer transporter ExbD [Myxococcales bacterium]